MVKNLKNSHKALSTMIIVAVVVVIIVVAGVAGYWYMTQNPATPANNTPTATPSSSTASPSPTSTTTGVAGASSLKYSVSLTENGTVQGTYTFWGKNAGTNAFSMRIEFTDSDGNTIYIFNGAQSKAWTYSGGEWVDISDYYSAQSSIWNNLWVGYTNNLSAWAGTGDQSYTQDGSTVRIYDISVNPSLDDALFTHS
jgi:hypothetical protein